MSFSVAHARHQPPSPISCMGCVQMQPVPYSLTNGDSSHGAALRTVRATALAAVPAQGAFDMFSAQPQAMVSCCMMSVAAVICGFLGVKCVSASES